jgi:hypothetical protein
MASLWMRQDLLQSQPFGLLQRPEGSHAQVLGTPALESIERMPFRDWRRLTYHAAPFRPLASSPSSYICVCLQQKFPKRHSGPVSIFSHSLVLLQ